MHDDVPPSIRPSLGRFENDLRDLLALLDDPAADGVVIDRLSARLCRELDEFRAAEVDDQDIEPEQRNQLHDALERALRLNAVARQLVGKRLGVIDAQLGLVRTARRALEREDDDETGESCDVEG